jgi:hypothetical protein
MPEEQQAAIHSVSDGGISGTHPDAGPFQFLVAPSTSNEFNTARLRLIPVACWKVEDIRFAFASSFVTPEIATELQDLVALRERHKKTDLASRRTQYPPISVFGHADPVGTDDYNKALSGRRAAVIYALLISNADAGTALSLWNSVARQESWGAHQRQTMHTATGLPASTPDSQLFSAYMQKLCPKELALTPKDFLAQGEDRGGKGDYQGCSSFNPLLIFSQNKEDEFERAKRDQNHSGLDARNDANAPNRRVMVLMFRVGSKVDPQKWPCPRATEGVAGCKKRFWSDGEERRGKHLHNQDRKYVDSHDTFACRFYHRLTSGSPCYTSDRQPLIIRFLDSEDQPIADNPYVLQVGKEEFHGKTDKIGQLSHMIRIGETTGRVDLGFFVFDLIISDILPIRANHAVQARLNNIGLFDEAPLDDQLSEPMKLAVMRFQQKIDMNTSGEADDSSSSKLKKVHDGYQQTS